MKKTVKKESYFCDVCEREVNGSSMLDKCIICGKSYCWSCKYDLYNVYSITICKKCSEKEPIATYLHDQWEKVWLAKRKEITETVKSMKDEAEITANIKAAAN